jgi:hypothetical protein
MIIPVEDESPLRSRYLDAASEAERAGSYDVAHGYYTQFRETFPMDTDGYVKAARLFRAAKRDDEAEALLLAGLDVCKDRIVIAIEYAWVAHYGGRHREALKRWEAVDLEFPLHPAGSIGIGRILVDLGELDRAETHLERALRKFPIDKYLLESFAKVASKREDWHEALRRWNMVDAIEPLKVGALGERGVALWHLQQKNTEYEPTGAEVKEPILPLQIERITDPRAFALVMKFESLGENCEVGLVQRRFQAEPLGLLRWTYVSPDRVVDMLASELDGLGELENVKIRRNIWNEYVVEDVKFGIGFHTFMNLQVKDEARFLDEQSARIRWLRRKLIKDLKSANKIFVYKAHNKASDDQMTRLFEVLGSYGRNRLLWVSQFDGGNPPGTVRRIADGLLKGYLSSLNPSAENLWNIPFDEWLSIFTAADEMVSDDSGN